MLLERRGERQQRSLAQTRRKGGDTMRPITALAVLMLIATASNSEATTTGSTLRYKLAPDQVLVYRAVAEIEAKSRGDRDGRRRRSGGERLEASTHLDMVFSYTAGETLPNGSTTLTIEVLAVTMTTAVELGHEKRRIEMSADGVKIYEGSKLVQNARWNEVNLPSGINLRALLDATIEAVISDRGEIERFADPELVKRLLRGTSFLHLLSRQPVLPPGPIQQGSTWAVDNELVVSNPLRLRELYRLPGTETSTAVGAVTHMNRRCLNLSIKGDWTKTEVAGEGKAKAKGSATAVIDLATGVMFTYSSKTDQHLEGAGTGGEAKSESTTTIQYLGGRQTYEHYKGADQSTDESTSE